MQTNEMEFSVNQKREGKLRLRMWLLFLLYAALVIGGIIVVFKTVMIALGAIIPLALYTLVLCTWRFVDVEQKYVIEAGNITVYSKFGNSKAKKMLSVKLKSASLIAPLQLSEDALSKIKKSNVYNALPHRGCDGAYVIIYTLDGVEKALLIQVIDATLKGLRYYNERTLTK